MSLLISRYCASLLPELQASEDSHSAFILRTWSSVCRAFDPILHVGSRGAEELLERRLLTKFAAPANELGEKPHFQQRSSSLLIHQTPKQRRRMSSRVIG